MSLLTIAQRVLDNRCFLLATHPACAAYTPGQDIAATFAAGLPHPTDRESRLGLGRYWRTDAPHVFRYKPTHGLLVPIITMGLNLRYLDSDPISHFLSAFLPSNDSFSVREWELVLVLAVTVAFAVAKSLHHVQPRRE
jgi:hypothetical protein